VDFRPCDWLVLGDESWNYPAWRAAARARELGAKTILLLYDLIPLRHPEFCAALFARVFPQWLLRMISNCDAVMCISRATEKELQAFCAERGISCPPTAHFRLGSDVLPEGGGTARAVLREFVLSSSPCFAAIGTIEPRKNHELLLAVFDRLWASGLDARLLVAGRSHPDSQGLVERMQQHPQQGRRLLTLLDASDAEIDMAYSSCRALLFPSLAEGFGLPLVEARARGCSVIASDLPALMELGDEGVHFFRAGDPDGLEALVRRFAAAPEPVRVAPMKIFGWSDSAAQFVNVAAALLRSQAATRDTAPEGRA
jgi:alpha-1,2-rhamnosyltransferase